MLHGPNWFRSRNQLGGSSRRSVARAHGANTPRHAVAEHLNHERPPRQCDQLRLYAASAGQRSACTAVHAGRANADGGFGWLDLARLRGGSCRSRSGMRGRGTSWGQHAGFVAVQTQRLQKLPRTGSGLPQFWQDDVIAYLCALSVPPALEAGAVCADLRYRAGDEHLTLFQHVVRQFGRLLQWWPQIWRAPAAERDGC